MGIKIVGIEIWLGLQLVTNSSIVWIYKKFSLKRWTKNASKYSQVSFLNKFFMSMKINYFRNNCSSVRSVIILVNKEKLDKKNQDFYHN